MYSLYNHEVYSHVVKLNLPFSSLISIPDLSFFICYTFFNFISPLLTSRPAGHRLWQTHIILHYFLVPDSNSFNFSNLSNSSPSCINQPNYVGTVYFILFSFSISYFLPASGPNLSFIHVYTHVHLQKKNKKIFFISRPFHIRYWILKKSNCIFDCYHNW